jgi:hypothetical protein
MSSISPRNHGVADSANVRHFSSLIGSSATVWLHEFYFFALATSRVAPSHRHVLR